MTRLILCLGGAMWLLAGCAATDPGQPTAKRPTLDLVITVADIVTRQPVTAAITIDDLVTTRRDRLAVRVDGRREHRVRVTAPDYERWEVVIRPVLSRSQQLDLSVLLCRP